MENVRSFISFNIPATPAVLNAREKLRGVRGVSVPKDVHLTLRFLGDVDTKTIGKLSERMRSLEEYRSFNVTMKGLGVFPNVKDPRVVWIGAEIGEPFYELLSELDEMLNASSISYDKKPFKAHVTVGRVRTPSKDLTDLLNEEKATEMGSFVCSEIFLMGSELTPNGAVHSVIGSFCLAGRS